MAFSEDGCLPFRQAMHADIKMLLFPFGISNVLCKVSLISLIDFTDGCCITDIICACVASLYQRALLVGMVK
jgi:hypothetical protein